jgi:hypothetical protein
MPSAPHDALVQIFKDRPQLAVEILRDLMGVELPATPLVQLENTSFNTRRSDDIHADLVMVLGPPQSPAHAVIVEIQRDTTKDPRQLARYAAALWLMLDCDVSVLVVCPDANAAARYAKPVASGLTGYRFQAHVLGPGDIPAITDPQQAAAQPELAAMAVMVHGRDRKVAEAFIAATKKMHPDYGPKYYEYAYSMSPADVRRLLEEIMTSTTWPVYSPFAKEHFGRGLAEGEAKGEAKAILLVLAARDLEVSDDARTRITACTDLAQLETWLTRAVTAQSILDLFGEI